MKNTILSLSIFLALVIGFITGFYSFSLTKSNPSQVSFNGDIEQDTFEAGWQAATEKLEESGIIAIEKDNLDGIVESISDNKIVFRTKSPNPLIDNFTKRTVIISSETEVVLYKERTEEEIKQARESIKKEYEKLSAEIIDLRAELNNCESESATDDDMVCLGIDQKIADKEDEAMNLSAGAENMEITLNPRLGNLEPGMSISVVAKALEGGWREDISEQKEFSAGRVELRKYLPIDINNNDDPVNDDILIE